MLLSTPSTVASLRDRKNAAGTQSFFAHWPDAARRLQKVDDWLLIFNYDGTLAPILPRLSKKSKMSEVTRRKLRLLMRRKNCAVAVMSGRSLADLRRVVGLHGVIYIGNSGLEIESNGWGFVHPRSAAAERETQSLRDRLPKALSTIRGVRLEDRKSSLAIHLRKVAPALMDDLKTRVFECLKSANVDRRRFLFQWDKHTLSIIPNLHWNKGSVAHWLKRVMPPRTLPFYVGGGPEDEAAFRELAGEGITLRIGLKKVSAASYYVRNQSNVSQVLDQLNSIGKFASD